MLHSHTRSECYSHLLGRLDAFSVLETSRTTRKWSDDLKPVVWIDSSTMKVITMIRRLGHRQSGARRISVLSCSHDLCLRPLPGTDIQGSSGQLYTVQVTDVRMQTNELKRTTGMMFYAQSLCLVLRPQRRTCPSSSGSCHPRSCKSGPTAPIGIPGRFGTSSTSPARQSVRSLKRSRIRN